MQTPGDGTKLGIIQNNRPPRARLLDITRLISRASRVPTGVDRVELAYLRRLATDDVPLFAISRTTLGYVLLDARGIAEILRRIDGDVPWGAADGVSVLARKKTPAVRQAESDLRRFAADRCRPRRLPDMLDRHLPAGTAYLNTGHSNLTDRMFWAVKHRVKGTISVLIHDTIPLDFPEFQRPGTPERFRAMLRRVQEKADLVIYNSVDTRDRARGHMRAWGQPVRDIVAHLGVEAAQADDAAMPWKQALTRPFFMALGTIEPRKQHGLLLDIWAELEAELAAADMPHLLICGARGWNNDAVFERLDALNPDGFVHEFSGVSDAAIAALLRRSRGLLFPSVAEGFGLPPVEAAALGVPVVCCDLAVYREILGDIPVYARESDRYQWKNAVKSLTTGQKWDKPEVSTATFIPPSWDEHFNTVLRLT